MNQSELTRLLAIVAADFGVTLGVDPERLASEAAKRVPAGAEGDPSIAFRKACETAARKIAKGERLERPGAFVVACMVRSFNGAGEHQAPHRGDASGRVDPFVQETIREIEEADAEIRRMPQRRHDAVAAIEHWRRTRFTSAATPAPHWALAGAESPESYRESMAKVQARWREERGLANPQPEGLQSIATVLQHSQTLGDLCEANNPYAEAGEE